LIPSDLITLEAMLKGLVERFAPPAALVAFYSPMT